MREWLSDVGAAFEVDAAEDAERNEERRREEPVYFGDDTFGRECCDVFQKMVASTECDVVWRALERRCEPGALTSRQIAYAEGLEFWRRNRGGEDDDLPAPPSLGTFCLGREDNEPDYGAFLRERPKHIADMARDLIAAVAEIIHEPIPEDTTAKRRARLRAAEAAAEKIKEEVGALWSGSTRRHIGKDGPQETALDDFAIRVLDRWLNDLDQVYAVSLDAESVAIAYQAGRQLARHPMEFLDAIVAETRAWANERPELARPNDQNAARLHFIRRLTAYFRDTYNEPLRACVLAVSGVFFDCSTLDEAAIVKLAP